MAGNEVAVIRNVIGKQRGQAVDVIAPVAMQFAGDTEPRHQLCARLRHAVPGRVAGDFVERARRVGRDEYIETFLDC